MVRIALRVPPSELRGEFSLSASAVLVAIIAPYASVEVVGASSWNIVIDTSLRLTTAESGGCSSVGTFGAGNVIKMFHIFEVELVHA